MFRRRALIAVLASAAIGLAVFVFWPAPKIGNGAEIDVVSFGGGEEGLLLVEPALIPGNYASSTALRTALDRYLAEARNRNWITGNTIIVFPEHVGTWLVAADAPPLAYRTRRFASAALALVIDDPIGFLRTYFRGAEPDKLAAALFRSRSAKMAGDYVEIFSKLAQQYGATIVAGSIALENPVVEGGKIASRNGPIYNVSAVFNPDGTIADKLVFKRHPIPSEVTFASEGVAQTPAFSTPAGTLGVLICADAWHPELYAELREQNVEIVASPSFLSEDDVWLKPWRGYVTPKPADVPEFKPDYISEGDAWMRYSLPARISAAGARFGGAAFLHGDLWDLGADGRTLATVSGENFVGEYRPNGAITLVRFDRRDEH